MKGLSPDPVTSPRQHWSLAVLCLLREGPMHPYEMRRLMKQRHKDERLVLKPGSLYNAVAALVAEGLVEEIGTSRDGGRPHRTTYRITPAGRGRVAPWIGRMLGEVRRDVSSFAVALDHLVHLTPAEAVTALAHRQVALAAAVADLEGTLAALAPRLDRILFIEVEHDLALCRAQHDWLERIIAEIRRGKLRWEAGEIIAFARQARTNRRAMPARRAAAGAPRS